MCVSQPDYTFTLLAMYQSFGTYIVEALLKCVCVVGGGGGRGDRGRGREFNFALTRLSHSDLLSWQSDYHKAARR